jgi:hypothetical protein
MLTGVDLAVESPPFRGILRIDRNILERDREVNEVEVEVINAPELELVPDELVGLWDTVSFELSMIELNIGRTRSFLW